MAIAWAGNTPIVRRLWFKMNKFSKYANDATKPNNAILRKLIPDLNVKRACRQYAMAPPIE
jgi:hypothetical protein